MHSKQDTYSFNVKVLNNFKYYNFIVMCQINIK